jgi:hypothetical protein
MANVDSEKQATDQNHESYADDAKARRVLLVGSSGTVGDSILHGHPDIAENVETTWVITRSDGQPDSESIYSSSSGTHTRTFTYNSSGLLTKRTAWVKA